jgi:hypothetical protein
VSRCRRGGVQDNGELGERRNPGTFRALTGDVSHELREGLRKLVLVSDALCTIH